MRHVFCLGSPHLGAPLEKGVNALGWALGRVPETRPLANLLGVRSAGIKDLRYGACVEEDWCDCDPDELLTDRCHDVPFLPGARFYFVAATLSRRPGDPLARSSETCSCASPAPRARARGARSASRSRTATTSAA